MSDKFDDAYEGVSRQAVANRLWLLRRTEGLTRTEFAKRAGITKTNYTQNENDDQPISLLNARKLKKRYRVSLDWIFEGEPSGVNPTLWERIMSMRSDYPKPDRRWRPGKGSAPPDPQPTKGSLLKFPGRAAR